MSKQTTTADDVKDKKDDVIEVDDAVAKAIAAELAPALKTMVDEAVKGSVDEMVEKKLESIEGVVRKDATNPGATDKDVKPVVTVKSKLESLGKERFFFEQVKAIYTDDRKALSDLNAEAIDTQVKAGYLGEATGTSADGAYLVPPADFLADVIRLEEQFGVVRQFARLYETNSNAVTLNKKTGSVSMYEIAEGAAKSGTKMQFGQTLIPLRKFAAIAALSDELVQDSPVNVYNELTIDYARENARWQDYLGFLDPTTGLFHQSGVFTVPVGSSVTSLTFDHLNQAIYNIPTPAMKNGRFYFEKTLLGLIQRIKDNYGRYIWSPGPNGVADGTIWGYPYTLTEVLPGLGQDANNKGFIAFGDMSYAYLIMKRGLQLTTLLEGTIQGSDGTTINLAEQDMTALRAVSRMNFHAHFASSFSIIGTGTVS
jgi:HK97 family phage major capsid protein